MEFADALFGRHGIGEAGLHGLGLRPKHAGVRRWRLLCTTDRAGEELYVGVLEPERLRLDDCHPGHPRLFATQHDLIARLPRRAVREEAEPEALLRPRTLEPEANGRIRDDDVGRIESGSGLGKHHPAVRHLQPKGIDAEHQRAHRIGFLVGLDPEHQALPHRAAERAALVDRAIVGESGDRHGRIEREERGGLHRSECHGLIGRALRHRDPDLTTHEDPAVVVDRERSLSREGYGGAQQEPQHRDLLHLSISMATRLDSRRTMM